MATTTTEFTDTEPNPPSSRRCCFCIPYTWQKIPTSSSPSSPNQSFWTRGVTALKKLREWSEIVAGPKWKTFIRRFNRNRSFNKGNKYQYDQLNYKLNFDEGLPLDNGDSEAENEYMMELD
ncbi:hypothetical protein CTI12_AA433850 [Artemisia annua]|uniref:Uncharacterized protein n=1 Tax=Artemisia annua TaxID=35608 RepID=A0A2U1LZL3_ARTAN|nr:hypothetical protein CTI12_AA433850 [Artemisia annua]